MGDCQIKLELLHINIPIKISINISTKHYLQTDFAENLLNTLAYHQLPTSYIALEINENLIMKDPEYSMKVIKTLTCNGIEIIVDNFGTGYSSINYLNQFKVNAIKIDRKFIVNILNNFQHLELVTAIIALAKKLDVKVIAEGIENHNQLQLLMQLGCDEFQGYHISKPILAGNVMQLIDHYNRVSEPTETT